MQTVAHHFRTRDGMRLAHYRAGLVHREFLDDHDGLRTYLDHLIARLDADGAGSARDAIVSRLEGAPEGYLADGAELRGPLSMTGENLVLAVAAYGPNPLDADTNYMTARWALEASCV